MKMFYAQDGIHCFEEEIENTDLSYFVFAVEDEESKFHYFIFAREDLINEFEDKAYDANRKLHFILE